MTHTLTHLFAHLERLERRVHDLVAHRRSDDPAPDDAFRGLYVSDEVVDHLLSPGPAAPTPQGHDRQRIERECDAAEAAGTGSRLRSLARAAALDDLDVDLLVTALAPDLDARYERLFGYLNDDVTRRRASIGLALEVAGASPTLADARARLAPGSPLVDLRLVLIEDGERPLLSRGLRVPDRVAAHLLGGDVPDPAIAPFVVTATPHPTALAADLARVTATGVRLVYLRDTGHRTAGSAAAAALAGGGTPAFVLDLTRLAVQPGVGDLVRIAGREALLRGAGLVAGPVEALAVVAPEAVGALATLPVTVMVTGTSTWDPNWSDAVPLLVEVERPTLDERRGMWAAELAGEVTDDAPPVHLQLGPDQIGRAVRSARLTAGLGGTPLNAALLQGGARAQNAAGLERLARRVVPAVAWPDLVLPANVRLELEQLAARARHRDRVLTEWAMRPGGGRGHGITALFAGDSGTGKTMSAEVIAGELGLDLYKVDLATVVDKYVGETEKNLERIFTEAGGVNGVLLFDEADAVFGKRSEVRDAHDRYANIESAYLLQRMETFDGLAILATNLKSNIDDAFTRRLDAIIDFPAPTPPERLALWQRCLVPPLPLAPDVDLDYCARAFELAGGNIRSIAVTAAYLAAARDEPVGMAHLITATGQEYRKLGRLVTEREFGGYLELLR